MTGGGGRARRADPQRYISRGRTDTLLPVHYCVSTGTGQVVRWGQFRY
jgi:hypothetical protein